MCCSVHRQQRPWKHTPVGTRPLRSWSARLWYCLFSEGLSEQHTTKWVSLPGTVCGPLQFSCHCAESRVPSPGGFIAGWPSAGCASARVSSGHWGEGGLLLWWASTSLGGLPGALLIGVLPSLPAVSLSCALGPVTCPSYVLFSSIPWSSVGRWSLVCQSTLPLFSVLLVWVSVFLCVLNSGSPATNLV